MRWRQPEPGIFHPSLPMTNPSSLLTGAVLSAAALLPAATAGEAIPQPNRLSFAARAAFHVRASFTTSLPDATTRPGPPTGGGLLRTYDDGFVGVDNRNNAGGQTWFWGYIADSQVDSAAGTLAFSTQASNGRATSAERDDDPHFGGELSYARTLFEWGRAFWGLELGANYTPVTIKDSNPIRGPVQYLRDTYAVGTTALPPAPYIGTHDGPGPLIGDSPTRTLVTREVVYTGRRELEATTFGFRLGPVLDIPMGEPLSLQISGGAYLLYSDAEFKYTETAAVEGRTLASRSGKTDAQDWTWGAYVRGQVLVSLTEHLGVFAGAEYLMLDEVRLGVAGHSAKLDFGESFAGFLGLAVSF